MGKVKISNINSLNFLRSQLSNERKPIADIAINLYKERKIDQFRTVENMLIDLQRKNNTKAISKINEIVKSIKPTRSEVVKMRMQSYEKKYLFTLRGKFDVETIYNKDKKQKKYYSEKVPVLKQILARNEAEAKKLWEQQIINDFENDNSGDSSTDLLKRNISNASSSIVYGPNSSSNYISPSNTFMRSSTPLKYDFILSDHSLEQNEGFCVIDNFVSNYSQYIKTLTKERFINLCYEALAIIKKPSPLDEGLDLEIQYNWNIDKGVTPTMLNIICQKLQISHYSFDITNSLFLKSISKNCNYPALVYYCINDHMYLVKDQKAVKSLIERSKDAEHKITSSIIKEDPKVISTESIYSKPIYEDIQISEINNYNDVIIMYNKTDLNDELDEIIRRYNIIPSKIKNDKYKTTQITYKNEGRIVYLMIDPNDRTRDIDYKVVKKYCEKFDIEFKNQTFTAMIRELRKIWVNNKSKRSTMTEDRRNKVILKCKNKCNICKKQCIFYEIDHIKPLSAGGEDKLTNLQSLCKSCHYEKTKNEQENNEYVRLSDSESSFNNQVKAVMFSEQSNNHAFIERINNNKPIQYQNNKIHNFDINKCRTNCLLYNQDYELPVFTVMDSVQPFNKDEELECGLYYVESENYFPLRCNGWYYLPLIIYCLENKIIKKDDIKYKIKSSLSIPSNYFDDFIKFCRSNLDEYAKIAVNSIIGNFKPAKREFWHSKIITKSHSEAIYHFLNDKSSIMDIRNINENFNDTVEMDYERERTQTEKDGDFYQIFKISTSTQEDTEAPFYHFILQLEQIELHKLHNILVSKDAYILDLNTDCISCVFPDNVNPFEMDDINLKGYYFDDEEKIPKYKLEDKTTRLMYPKMEKTYRHQKYIYNPIEWNVLDDVEDNNFEPLINQVYESKKSFNILGPAGAGKTKFIKDFQKLLDSKNNSYMSLAPTNKAALHIGGKTVHKFCITNSNRSNLSTLKAQYIFVDEISMLQEMFYKFFIVVKKMRPDIIFIMCGDFRQLMPVNDRVGLVDYKNSVALHELCDGNRLQLSKCRRSDDVLFTMCMEENIMKLRKSDFKNEFRNKHISFTNAKRREVNNIMMNNNEKKILKTCSEKKIKIVRALELKALPNDPNSQDVKLFVGTPVIARVNNKALEFVNNEEFTISKIIDDDEIILTNGSSNITIDVSKFQKLFYVAYCITSHKSQGVTINGPYTLHEFERYSPEMRYVALSRATKLEYINVV